VNKRVHAGAGIVAIVLVGSFAIATTAVEIIGDEQAILAVKTVILFALVVLIPSVVVANGSGRSLAAGRRSPLLTRKKRRATAVAVIGIVVLVPCAIVLRILAAAADFGTGFVILQAVELIGGVANFTLLACNARDGRTLTAGRRRSAAMS
jgi:hypothetical protein